MSNEAILARPSGLLRNLTRLQHVLFAALVGIGLGQGWRGGAAAAPLLLSALALSLWYVVGARRSGHPSVPAHGRPGSTADPERVAVISRYAVIWLLVLTLLWVVCVAVSSSFVWVAFALWMLAGHLLGLGWAAGYSVAVLAVTVLAPPLEGAEWTVAGIVGPVVGALFALALSRGQVQLARDAFQRARLVDSLLRAQRESAALQEELLVAQREAGALTERTRLSRDIHDTLAQGFSSILLLSRGAATTGDGPGLRRLLHRIEQTAATNLEESRRVVAALAPQALSDAGLAAVLRRALDDLSADTGIQGELRIEPGLPQLGTTQDVALLRTTQGALANVRQHARATRVVISLSLAGEQVRLDIVDDGVGFEPSRVAAHPSDVARGGYGLASTRARLTELGGGLTIESAPGEGTAVSAHLPMLSPRTAGSATGTSEGGPR